MYVEDVLLNCCDDVIDCMLDFVEMVKGIGKKRLIEDFSWCEVLIVDCMKYVLIKGIDKFIVEDMEEVC